MRILATVLIALMAMLLLAGPAGANGGYFAKGGMTVALPNPEIPLQRALIVHRDGVETLIVESTARTASPEVGWVLPLPAEPTDLAQADPGLLLTLDLATLPKVSDRSPSLAWALRMLALAGAVLLLAVTGRLSGWRGRAMVVAGLVFLIVLASVVFLPTLSSGSLARIGAIGGGGPGVEVRSTQRVGSYDVSVLKATDPADLAAWLDDAGLARPDEAAQAILADYIAEGWCFLAARLATEGAEELTPHPLQVTFPAEQPVYPMRLTAIGGSTTRVELFVVADGQASAEGFECILADRLQAGTYDPYWGASQSPPLQLFKGEELRQGLAHPAICPLLWNGVGFTRLQADLAPAAMDRDVRIALGPLQPYRQELVTPRVRTGNVQAAGVKGLAVMLLVGALLTISPARYQKAALVLVLLAAGVTVAGAIRAYVAAEVYEGPLAEGRDAWMVKLPGHAERELTYRVGSLVDEGQLHAGQAEGDASALMAQLAEGGEWWGPIDRNPFTGQPIRQERSPGNFMILREEGRVWFCAYGMGGREARVELPPAPAVQPASAPGP